VIVRWEKACGDKWCHRSLAANWLSEAPGEAVPELSYEGLTQDCHPLLRPPLAIQC
jgi:hypothetical protein